MPSRALTLAAIAAVALCGCHTGEPEVIAAHDPAAPEILGLERLDPAGAYVAGQVDRFRVLHTLGETAVVSWAASGGSLLPSGSEVEWELPPAPEAELTVTVEGSDQRQIVQTFKFAIVTAAAPQAGAVDTSSDATGSVCDLSFDSSGNPRIVYMNDTHPSLWYAAWNGTAWQTELVDGMGFGVGGKIAPYMAMVLDGSNAPHIAYAVEGKGIFYATKSGASWTLERVDSGPSPYPVSLRVAIALDPARSNRPTVAYTVYDAYYNSGWASYFDRPGVAYRTGPASWTTYIADLGTNPNDIGAAGGLAIDSSGTMFFSYSWNIGLVGYNPDSIPAAATTTFGSGSYFMPVVLDATEHPLVMSGYALYQAALPLGAATENQYEQSVMSTYDLVYRNGKPVLAVNHSGDIEIITPDARGYWTYTNLGSTAATQLSLAIDPSGAPHVCHRLAGRISYL